MLIIVLLLFAGLAWWLYSTRRGHEKNIRVFAGEVAKQVAVNYDERYLHIHLSPDGQKQYLRSWRDRFLDQLRGLGVPAQPIEIQGDPVFTSYFFDPHGQFKALLRYPNTTAELNLEISRSMTVWQIDTIALYWTPPPQPTPSPTPVMTPTPSPTPAAKAKRTRR